MNLETVEENQDETNFKDKIEKNLDNKDQLLTEKISNSQQNELLDEQKAVMLIHKNSELSKNIYQKEAEITNLKKIIKQNEKDIWKLCSHEWERDWSCAFDEHTKHFCKKCKLWRNSYWYV